MSTELPNADKCRGDERLHRLTLISGTAYAEPMNLLSDSRDWISMVSSRLGHDVSHHRHVSRFLSRAMLDCNRRNGVALIAVGSAIEPLATRAAELFQVPVLRIGVVSRGSSGSDNVDLVVRSDSDEKLDRDQIVIMLADRVDVLHARRGGKMAQYAEQRILQLQNTSTRVAISAGDDVARGLVACGGIGWHLSQPDNAIDNVSASSKTSETCDDSPFGPGEWLVHCTRGTSLPWPNETINQFRDAILLNEADNNERDAFHTLLRIVRGRKLLAACHASDRHYPVVCFSAVPLPELIRRRKYRSHLHRWDYEPYGVALRTSAAESIGVRPVVYGTHTDRSHLAVEDHFLFQAKGKTYDWTSEREWRSGCDVDLHKLGVEDVRIFTQTENQATVLRRLCGWSVYAVERLT